MVFDSLILTSVWPLTASYSRRYTLAMTPSKKHPNAAAAMVKMRLAKVSPARRKEIAQNAVTARWSRRLRQTQPPKPAAKAIKSAPNPVKPRDDELGN